MHSTPKSNPIHSERKLETTERTKPTKRTSENHQTPLAEEEKALAGTAMWVVLRLRDQPMERAIGILDIWTHKKRRAEVSNETVLEINKLPLSEA